jgi:hypothetical protein
LVSALAGGKDFFALFEQNPDLKDQSQMHLVVRARWKKFF